MVYQLRSVALSNHERALSVMDQINTMVGPNCCSAVSRCINCDYYQSGIDFDHDPSGRRLIFSVLDLLERDLKNVMG
jgi:hypothetical protein